MKSLFRPYLHALTFSGDQLSTIQRLGEARGRQCLFVVKAPEQLEALRAAAIVESSESSNRIEGVFAERGRVEALVLKSSQPRNRSEQEIAGYRDALALIQESHAYMGLTPNVVLQLHAMLYRYLPSQGGVWKPADNEIVERNPDGTIGRVRFRAVPAVLTPRSMDDLVVRYADAVVRDVVEPLIAVPLAVLDFLCIHPFRDGNGRMARLLTLLLLYQHRYDVGRYVSLERIIEESKETYYESLERSSQGWHEGTHDAMPWLEYFWGTLLRAYAEFEERVGTMLSGRGFKTELVRQAVARRIGPFSLGEIEADSPGVSRDMVRHVLRQMRDEGLVEAQGLGRGARWIKKETA